MKKQAYTMIALLVLVGSMAVAAQAQTSGHTKLISNIPFEFNVGNTTLPAGEYTVAQVNPASDHASASPSESMRTRTSKSPVVGR